MRIGICEWTTFPASFEEELAAYRLAGAGGIGILEFKLAGAEDVRGKLRESGLVATACLCKPTRSDFDRALPVEEIARRSVESMEAL